MHPLKLFAVMLLSFSPLLAAEIEVDGAYVREVPPTMSNTAAFMTLSSLASEPISLLGATSNVAHKVELHTHTNVNGMMQMHQVEKIDIAAEGTTVLQPGGFHIMLIGLKCPLKEGDIVNMNLNFSNGESVAITAPVQTISKSMQTPMRCGNGKCGSGKCGGK